MASMAGIQGWTPLNVSQLQPSTLGRNGHGNEGCAGNVACLWCCIALFCSTFSCLSTSWAHPETLTSVVQAVAGHGWG